jgi:uncharacterized protein YkwD
MTRLLPFGFLVSVLVLLAACGGDTIVEQQPAFYDNLAQPGKEVNVTAATSLFSDYRRSKGLPAVEPDERLVAAAREQVRRMIAADKVTHDPGGRGFIQRLKASGFNAATSAENVSAGYHTLAEAFSGWRDSPGHNKNMLLPGATRFGIASAYTPKSKYRVFWALILAEPAN